MLPPMNWWRMTRVNYGTGGYLNISYYPEDCAPGDLPRRTPTDVAATR